MEIWLNPSTCSLLLTSNQQLLPLLSLTFYVVLIFFFVKVRHTQNNKEKITNRKQPNFHCATLNELLYSAPTNLSQISFFIILAAPIKDALQMAKTSHMIINIFKCL